MIVEQQAQIQQENLEVKECCRSALLLRQVVDKKWDQPVTCMVCTITWLPTVTWAPKLVEDATPVVETSEAEEE